MLDTFHVNFPPSSQQQHKQLLSLCQSAVEWLSVLMLCFSIPFCTRVYLNIIYTMVETMRYADPGDCDEMAQAQEAFFTELSKYLRLSRSLSENHEWSKPHKKIKDS